MSRAVLVHGFLGSPEDWSDVRAQLNPSINCECVSLRDLGCASIALAAEALAIQLAKNPCDLLVGYSMGGRIALLGIPPGKSPVDWSRIVFKAITIKGVYGREIFETWYKMIAMLENGLDVRNVITHRFKVDEFEAGFGAMLSGSSGKVVLDWT